MRLGYTFCAKMTEPKSVSEPEYIGRRGRLEYCRYYGWYYVTSLYTLPYKIYREVPTT